MIKAIIIDDESKSIDTLNGLLKRYCENIEVIATADGCESGIKSIKSNQPDVVFLDIQMPDGSGFKLLEGVGDINFEIIFTTAYDQFAIKAIKYSALDYLLKPIDPDDLKKSVEKLKKQKQNKQINDHIKVLLENIKSTKSEPSKIILSTSEGMHVVKVSDIIRCESDDYYTRFFLINEKIIMVSKTLKENEELLKGHHFIRPHRSHLVNTRYIRSFLRTDGGTIVMSDGNHIPVSRRKREKIVEIISNL
ncbi:LytR/AlgR family response regulator transcription factor [candidate division KSB1 bacterium]